MRILLPSIVDPRVARGGAWTATRGLLALLHRGPLPIETECVAIAERSAARHRLRQAACAMRSLVSPLPAKALFVRSRRMLTTVRRRLRERDFDLVVLNGSDLLWLLPELPPSMPRVLVAHNLEHQLYASQIMAVGPRRGLVGRLLARDLARLRTYELTGLRSVRNVIFLSSVDADDAGRACPNLNALVVPPVFDGAPHPRLASRGSSATLEIGFMANFDWWPNREGLRWFLDRVFPAVSDRTRLHLFGRGAAALTPAHPHVITHGFVAKVEDVWDQCDLMICPVLSGGGVCVKVAEAVYNGVPTLSTTFGARGLPLLPDPHVVRLDGADAWIQCLTSRYGPPIRRQRVSARCAEPFRAERNAMRVHEFLAALISAGRNHADSSPRRGRNSA